MSGVSISSSTFLLLYKFIFFVLSHGPTLLSKQAVVIGREQADDGSHHVMRMLWMIWNTAEQTRKTSSVPRQ